MKSITFLATGALLVTVPYALAGDLCLSAACTLAPPGQGPACGWWQMWSPGVDVCGPGTRELNLGDDLESYLVNNGPMILDDICGVTAGLSWGDGGPFSTTLTSRRTTRGMFRRTTSRARVLFATTVAPTAEMQGLSLAVGTGLILVFAR